MPNSEADRQNKKRACRKRADTLLIFDPAQKVPDIVLNAILQDWVVPCIVDQLVSKFQPQLKIRSHGDKAEGHMAEVLG